MQPSMIEENRQTGSENRVARLKHAVQHAKPGVCTERALIWTQYHKDSRNKNKPVQVQMAEALRDVLLRKKVTIYADELIVGNFSSKRVGGSIYPELHGVPMLEDLFRFSTRQTNPLQISKQEVWTLLKIAPYWSTRFLAYRAVKPIIKKFRFIFHQLAGRFYLINESGGIAHLAPDYKMLINIGTDAIIERANSLQQDTIDQSEQWAFYEGVKIIAEGLAQFGERYALLAEEMAAEETDSQRRKELEEITQTCRRVPRKPSKNFREALQAIFFAQIAINLESLDNAISPGRMDQYLYPYYQSDIQAGNLTPQQAKELLAAFSIKMSELIPVFSKRLTRIHGGIFNGQVVTVGGVNSSGEDSVNELSTMFLDVMNELRMRQPNFHARVHKDSPAVYIDRINDILAAGSNSPALYNDEVIVETMRLHGYSMEDARNYTAVGCVEPVSQGKSFSSTDAALVNVPILLELALNEGRRFGALLRSGAKTKPASQMGSVEDVKAAFETQLQFQLDNLIEDLQAVEMANRKYHPTPLTSALLDGCLESGVCSTAGGARYNYSGVQCVGPVDTGDALYAIEKSVFLDRKLSLEEMVSQLTQNLPDGTLLAYLRQLAKFGNDEPAVDRWMQYVVETFVQGLSQYSNTRGGPYTTGLYTVTAHQHFGSMTGALPHGRRKAASFASGIAPVNGMDRNGPTALFNSVNSLDYTRFANGVNLNIKFDQHTLRGEVGRAAMVSLLKTYFRRGGMQVQVNVLDPQVLIQARNDPEAYPYLLVRVSGYSAYFNDLTPEMQDEIIQRSNLGAAA